MNSNLKNSQALLIGVGNDYRSDDAIGLWVARELQKQSISSLRIVETSGDGAELMELWKNEKVVILVDAVNSGSRPGTIHRIQAHTETIPTRFFSRSTHAFGVAEAVELSRTLQTLPPYFMIYGIEGKRFDYGTAITKSVMHAAQVLIQEFRNCVV